MISFLRKHRAYLIIFLVILALLQLLAYRRKHKKDLNFFDQTVLYLASPMQAAVSTVAGGMSSLIRQYIWLVQVKKNSDVLRKENGLLRQKLIAMKEFELENTRLLKLLDIKKSLEPEVVHAKAVATGVSTVGRTVKINKGSNDGVRLSMPVISTEGALGKIIQISVHYSDVLLLSDVNSYVDVLNQRNRARAAVVGNGFNRLQLINVNREEDIREGDILVTSGLGGVWPKGVVVGTVSKVQKKDYGIFLSGEVDPANHFGRIEDVMVIKYQSLLMKKVVGLDE